METLTLYPVSAESLEDGGEVWLNPDNALELNGEFASVPLTEDHTNRFALAYDASDLPDGATITAITWVLTGYASGTPDTIRLQQLLGGVNGELWDDTPWPDGEAADVEFEQSALPTAEQIKTLGLSAWVYALQLIGQAAAYNLDTVGLEISYEPEPDPPEPETDPANGIVESIVRTLTADEDVSDLATGGVWEAVAPRGSEPPFVIVTLATSDTIHTHDGARTKRGTVDVKAITAGDSFIDAEELRDAFDSALAELGASKLLGVQALLRGSEIRYPEWDGDTRYNHCGYQYDFTLGAPQ